MFYEEVEEMTEEERYEKLVKLINYFATTKNTTAFNFNVKSDELDYKIKIKLIQN